MVKNKVSILMNGHNAARYLRSAISSIYSQSYEHWELIYIDNSSDDNTREIINEFDNRIKYVETNEKLPLGRARNYGLNYCDGEYLAFLDTDDVWLDDKLQKQVEVFQQNESLGLCYGGFNIINENGEIIKTSCKNGIKIEKVDSLIHSYDINMQTVMIRNSKKFSFNEDFEFAEDYEAFLKVVCQKKALRLGTVLANYRIHNTNISRLLKRKWAGELRDSINSLQEFSKGKISSNAIAKGYAKADYYEARFELEDNNNNFLASKLLLKNGLIDFRYLILGLIALMPRHLWLRLHRLKML
jgi:glycosyltransferase involved in cell wall biosynthesis